MQPRSDTGQLVLSNFGVNPLGEDTYELILESRGGERQEDGNARNEDYQAGLRLILGRAAKLGLILQRVEIASRRFDDDLSSLEKTLDIECPINLAEVDARDQLAPLQRSIQAKASRFLQAPNATGGNRTRRLRLVLGWDAPRGVDAEELEQLLAKSYLTPPLARSQYAPLGAHLWASSLSRFTMTLEEIAALGIALPPEASRPQFWANVRNHHPTRRGQWLEQGWRAFYVRDTRAVQFAKLLPRREDEGTPSQEVSLALAVERERLRLARTGEAPKTVTSPARVGQAVVSVFRRRASVIAFVLNEAKGRCECCDQPAPFLHAEGWPFLEVHHVRFLSQGGPDDASNAAALCPNCHRALHHGRFADASRAKLISSIPRLVDYPVRRVDVDLPDEEMLP